LPAPRRTKNTSGGEPRPIARPLTITPDNPTRRNRFPYFLAGTASTIVALVKSTTDGK
jgi:hypothetical protein